MRNAAIWVTRLAGKIPSYPTKFGKESEDG